MNQEELKTCLGQLLLDLRGNWAFNYSDRLYTALELCDKIEYDTSDIERRIHDELEGDFDGRIFRGALFYGYSSEEGITEEVKKWLENNLSFPEYCSIIENL